MSEKSLSLYEGVAAAVADPPNDALVDELAALRRQRAELLSWLRTEQACGATVVRIGAVRYRLGVR